MLITSNKYSEIFLEKKMLLIDSCVMNDLATCNYTKNILDKIEETYNFVFCNISMLEVGFGPKDKADMQQVTLAKSIYSSKSMTKIDAEKLGIREFKKIKASPGERFAYNPIDHEYLAARTSLIGIMEMKGLGGKQARKLNNDALIYACAWNCRASIVTNNIKDFKLINDFHSQKNSNHLLPIFTVKDLENSLNQEVSFPGNIKV